MRVGERRASARSGVQPPVRDLIHALRLRAGRLMAHPEGQVVEVKAPLLIAGDSADEAERRSSAWFRVQHSGHRARYLDPAGQLPDRCIPRGSASPCICLAADGSRPAGDGRDGCGSRATARSASPPARRSAHGKPSAGQAKAVSFGDQKPPETEAELADRLPLAARLPFCLTRRERRRASCPRSVPEGSSTSSALSERDAAGSSRAASVFLSATSRWPIGSQKAAVIAAFQR